MVDFSESDKTIKASGKVDKSNTYNGFNGNISFRRTYSFILNSLFSCALFRIVIIRNFISWQVYMIKISYFINTSVSTTKWFNLVWKEYRASVLQRFVCIFFLPYWLEP